MTAPASDAAHAARLRDVFHHLRRSVEEGDRASPAELTVAVRRHADGGGPVVIGLAGFPTYPDIG